LEDNYCQEEVTILFEGVFERVQYYKKLGLNPLALATGCAVKVDLLKVVYPAIRTLREELKGSGLSIAPREDALIIHGEVFEIYRRVYQPGGGAGTSLHDLKSISREGKLYAVAVLQIFQRYADSPESFLEKVAPIYRALAKSGISIILGKGHSILTPFPDDEFMLFDFIPGSNGGDGFTIVNNDTIHIIDPSQEPGDTKQVSGAISNSFNDVFVLGAHKKLRMLPVLNAPTEELLDKLWSEVKRFASQYGIDVINVEQPRKGRLLMGATTIGYNDKTPPVFEDEVSAGMKLIITRPMGELAPINLYLSSIIDESLVKDLGDYGIPFEEVERAKNKAVELISKPNIEASAAIYKYLPDTPEQFRRDEHIVVTTDVTGPGIFVIKELAERTKTKIKLFNVPLLFPEISKIVTKLYVMPNSTSGTNGPFIIVAPDTIIDDLIKELRSKGLDPIIMGEVIEKNVKPEVIAPRELKDYIADQKILSEFILE
jgi:selenophosphate synthase